MLKNNQIIDNTVQIVGGDLDQIKRKQPSDKKKKYMYAKVIKGREDSKIAFRKNENKERSSLRVILRKEAEKYPEVAFNTWWKIEYMEDDNKNYAWGTPVERAETDCILSIKLASEEEKEQGKKDIVGMKFFCKELGPDKGLIFQMPFPGENNRKMTNFFRNLMEAKIARYKNQKYAHEIKDAYMFLLERLRDDERAYISLLDGFRAYLETMELPEELGSVSSAPVNEVVEMLMEGVTPFNTNTIPENKEQFIQSRIEFFHILGCRAVETETGIGLEVVCDVPEEIAEEVAVEV